MELDLYSFSLSVEFILIPVIFILLFFFTAPYGRFDRKGWGPVISSRLAWLFMESPTLIIPLSFLFFYSGRNPYNTILLLIWLSHYFHRTVIYPFTISSPKKPFSILIMSWGFLFNVINSYINFYFLFAITQRNDIHFLTDLHFMGGLLLFFSGYAVNKNSDGLLRKLRADGKTGYSIPRGGLYRWISVPNYLGEIVEWGGWALMVWSLPGLAFLLFTIANLLPRALKIHKWYGETFSSYPEERKAIIPFLL